MNIVYTYISIDPQFVTFGGVPIKLDSRCLGVESVPSLKTQTFNFLTLLGPSGEGEACQVESMKVWHLVRREDWFTCGIVRAAFVSILPSRSTCCTITISLMKMTNRMIDQPTCRIGQELNNVHQIPVSGAGEAADWPCSSPGGTAQSSLSFLCSLDFYMWTDFLL